MSKYSEQGVDINNESNSEKTVIYIDGANLHCGIKNQGESIDYKRLYWWLKLKFKTEKIIIFMGFLPQNQKMYDLLALCGFQLIFKETQTIKTKTKGNCDAELVLQAVRDVFEMNLERGILISNDGDFACLVEFWKEKSIKCGIISPQKKYCSIFLKRKNIPLYFVDDHIHKINKMKRPPREHMQS